MAGFIGIGVIISIPVHWALRLAATGGWIFASVWELVVIYRGYRRYWRIRLYSPGQISLQTTAGDWQAAELISGSIVLPVPGIPPVPFSVDLTSRNAWNYAIGAAVIFSSRAHLSVELGFGDRDHTLVNFTYRF